jgi:pSer/pThr/pTyr-binding forkhead associated (FHA) protein
VKTSLLGREPTVTRIRTAPSRQAPRNDTDRVSAAIRYEDDSGSQTFFVTQDQVSIGRGGADVWVDLPLEASDEISREHVRIRRDAATGEFTIRDQSRNGTWLNGRRLKRDVAVALPDSAEIGLANVVRLHFEVRHA